MGRKLTEQEVKFIKDTGVTPTIIQCDEYDRTTVKDFNEVSKVAKEYDVDLNDMLEALSDADCISLDYMGAYLLYTFFSEEELEALDFKNALKWLKDFKYFCGFRKWTENMVYGVMEDAMDLHSGYKVMYEDSSYWFKIKGE